MKPAPIALFVYRRPSHTQRTLDALANAEGAAQHDLHVFSDAPRDPAAEADVREVRRIVRAARGFRAVEVMERPANLGLARSIVDGVSTLLARDGVVVVVEDDLEVAPQFLRFMQAALEHYAGEPVVRQVSGYMFPVRRPQALPESFFLPLTTSWGWATWARAWGEGPGAAGDLLARVQSRSDADALSLHGAYDYLGMLRDEAAGRIDSWAIRWYARTWLSAGLVLYPRHSLVRNAGLDGSGTHRGSTVGFEASLWDNPHPPGLPPAIESSVEALSQVTAFLRANRPPAWRQWMGRVRMRLHGPRRRA